MPGSMRPYYRLDGTAIKNPTDFEHEWYRVTNAQRNAKAYMIIDNIAVKRKYNLNWTHMSHMELQSLRQIIFGSSTTTWTFTFYDANESNSLTVYAGALKYKKFRTGGVWYYTDISLSLIEQ